jgi:replicative DNA helicase
MSNWLPHRLPEDTHAERGLIATCCAPGAGLHASEMAEMLTEKDFVVPKHQAVFKAMTRLVDAQSEISPFSLKDALDKAGDLNRVGDFVGLVELLEASEVAHPNVLAEILIRKRKARELIHIGARLVQEASKEEVMPDALIDRLSFALVGLSKPIGGGLKMVSECSSEALEGIFNPSRNPGVRTGFSRVDAMTKGGFRPGQLIVLAARPGQGKSALALNWAHHAGQAGHVVFFSLEMTAREQTERLLAMEYGADPREAVDVFARRMVDEARCRVDSLSIAFDDAANLSVREIRHRVERQIARGLPLCMVVVDYLQLISSPEGSRGAKLTESLRIAEISRALKVMAKELSLPVVLLSQLNREIENRQGGKPQLSDLRDSGAIEQDADLVMFVSRKLGESAGTLTLAKHRGGPCGEIPLEFDGARFQFVEGPERSTGPVNATQVRRPRPVMS